MYATAYGPVLYESKYIHKADQIQVHSRNKERTGVRTNLHKRPYTKEKLQ